MTARALKTKRNAHIRDLAAKGYTRKQIARVVNIHPNTVKSILDAFVAKENFRRYRTPRRGSTSTLTHVL